MRPVELEIVQRGGTVSRETIEVATNATLGQITLTARQLLRVCGWRRVRVGVGNLWSRWIH